MPQLRQLGIMEFSTFPDVAYNPEVYKDMAKYVNNKSQLDLCDRIIFLETLPTVWGDSKPNRVFVTLAGTHQNLSMIIVSRIVVQSNISVGIHRDYLIAGKRFHYSFNVMYTGGPLSPPSF